MSVPKHIGVILDGNRRFAKRLMLKPWKGHEWGAEKFQKFVDWCFSLGVEEITAYVFSLQNFNRPKEEFAFIMDQFRQSANDLLKPERLAELNEQGVRITFIGRRHLLPDDLQQLQMRVMDATKEFGPKRINFALAYGGREEIVDAIQHIADDAKNGTLDPAAITEETVREHLWLGDDPDLIIRTGGEQRTSNFLPWQSTYSEWFFIDKLWPEIEEEDVKQCLAEFSERERRFGK